MNNYLFNLYTLIISKEKATFIEKCSNLTVCMMEKLNILNNEQKNLFLSTTI